MKRLVLLLLLLSPPACKDRARPPAAPLTGDAARNGDSARATDARGDDEPATPGDPLAAAIDAQLPANWEGEGILVRRQERVPRRAPQWASIAAEVVRRDEQRFVQATGKAERIRNQALARSTAEARALAEIARWVRSERLVGAVPIDGWRDPKTGVTFARVAMPVPEDWTPGRPLHQEETTDGFAAP